MITTNLNNGVVIEGIAVEEDFCQECGTDTSDSEWYSDQDGIYVQCDECGETTFHESEGFYD